MSKRELENVRRELRSLKTGQHEIKRQNKKQEKLQWTRRSRTSVLDMPCVIRGAERTSTCEECQHIHEKAVAEAAYFDYATVKNNLKSAEVKILVGAGPRGETFARAVHRKRAKFEDLDLFCKVLQTRHGHIPVYCDQEECLREVVHNAAERLVLANKCANN